MQKESVQTNDLVLRKRPKLAKTCQDMSTFYVFCKIAILEHVLNVSSEPRHRFELIPFALGQATQGTSLEYPQGIF